MSATATNEVTFDLGAPEKNTRKADKAQPSYSFLFLIVLIPLAIAGAAICVAAVLWVRVEQLETLVKHSAYAHMSTSAVSPAGFSVSMSALTGTGSWAPGVTMPSAHSDQHSVFCADRIVLLGGQDANKTTPTILRDVLSFDPVHEVYSVGLASMPTPRFRFGAACLNGKIYVAGGFENAEAGMSGMSLKSVDVYDVDKNTWTSGPPLKAARGDLALAAADGALFAIGGYDTTYTPLATNEKLSPGSNAWVVAAPMPRPKGDLQAAVIDGKVYVPGGWNVEHTFMNELAVYDASADSWDLAANMSVPRADMAVTALGGRLYVIGGEMWSGKMSTCDWGWGPEACAVNLIPMHGVEMYDPKDGVWTAMAPLPESRFRFAAAAVEGRGSEGAIFAFGGHAHGEVAVDTLWTFHAVAHKNLYFHVPLTQE